MGNQIAKRNGDEVYAALWRLSAFVGFAMAGSICVYTLSFEPLPEMESPFYVRPIGLGVAAALAVISMLQLVHKGRPPRAMRAVYLVSYLAGAFAMLNLFRFDPREQLFVLLIVAMALAAMMLTMKGAFIMWAAAATGYGYIEWRAQQTSGVPADVVVAVLRMVVMLFVATLVAKLVEHFAASTDAEQKRAREVAYHARLLDQVRDGVIATDPAGSLTTWNRGAEQIYGWMESEVLGKNIDSVLQPKSLDVGSSIPDGDPHDERSGLFLHRVKDGSAVLVEAAGLPIEEDGCVTGYVTVNRDVTERLRAEEAARTAEVAEQANIAKDEFIARMSHELRTPLNAVLGFAQLLIMDGATPSQRENAEQIMRGGTHLLTLIDEIHDTTQIEGGSLPLDCVAVPVSTAVDETVTMVGFLAHEKGVTLTAPADSITAWIFADKVRFKQVLLNLLSNAIKYNRQGGEVATTVDETGDGYARITVSDTGSGIAPDMMDRLFTPFDRLGAEATGVEGSGLGLALSKRLTEAMGGRISASSEPGVGSRFSIELPMAAAGSFEADIGFMEAHWQESETAKTHTVLYIEDQLSNLRLMERVFDKRPHISLVAAMQGQLGVEIARQNPPDLVLLDMHLPDIPGDEVLKRLHQDPRTAEVAVVVISADVTDLTTKRMLAAGALDYLSKPVDVSRLLELVDAQIDAKEHPVTGMAVPTERSLRP